MKAFYHDKRKFYVKVKTSCLLMLLVLMSGNGLAKQHEAIDYTQFLSEAENFFLFKPELINDIFYGLVELKGNEALSRKIINRDVLKCQHSSLSNKTCSITRYKYKKRSMNVPEKLTISVTFTRITAEIHNKKEKRVILTWQPELFKPPLISVESFLSEIYAASESRYYKLKEGIGQIQLNPEFERQIIFITDNAMANSLLGVYRSIPTDGDDLIEFDLDYVVPSKRYQIMDVIIHLKATSVTINHQTFKTVERERLK